MVRQPGARRTVSKSIVGLPRGRIPTENANSRLASGIVRQHAQYLQMNEVMVNIHVDGLLVFQAILALKTMAILDI